MKETYKKYSKAKRGKTKATIVKIIMKSFVN